ncbi:NUDIX hydrolase [Sneathiella sp. HT1-7]|jgi:8-oxo-dGTP pyrophosphatase MutT (NUDIX family)|uniref:NUDIX hydrolase n=1 Tax=Sneathiella sp. HT1-7 TaxID=2887192 RepID=UPI001D156922|nr:NUDIX domain-containing protein [Sneathiella sp. HT1-7]MCC3304711.1 NUDIX domain-containing protein [Sneathiella sp. HT1-7]
MTKFTRQLQPVKPRHAASLVIYEQRADDLYVLMGRRSKAHRFLPDVYVFPGGRVDKSDASMTPLAPLAPDIEKMLSQPAGMAHAVAAAAVRETHEETGLIIGDLQGDQLVPDLSQLDFIARAITPPKSPIRFNTRFLTVDAKHITGGDLGGSGELVDLHWIPLSETHRVPLIDVTEFVLDEIDRKIKRAAAPLPRQSGNVPIFTYYKGKPFIRNHDND